MNHWSDYLAIMFLLFYCIVSTILFNDSNIRAYETKTELEAQLKIRDNKIEELEKQIRILKTDLQIKENGFPEK